MKRKSADGFISKQFGKAVIMDKLSLDIQYGKIYYLREKLRKIKSKYFLTKK